MQNFFTDNSDILFHFDRFDLREIVDLIEAGYSNAERYPYAPVNYEDAKENYRRLLEVVGDIAGNFIAERAAAVDEEGAHFEDGRVTYAKGTAESLERLAQADLSGMILPYEYGGLNIPFTVYTMVVEILSRADASLINIFGLQDIGDCIRKFGHEDQWKEYLPGFSTGEVTGAMALTEPDAGSDLQSVKLTATQDPATGHWRLRGVKRFITNGNGQVLLVLARSEAGTKDARGLSVFVCRKDDSVVVRRIEHKLGIHGSPTCELQFNDTPAQLLGKRKLGLIKYVLDLMYRARMGIAAQALGIAQAAYEEALKYAKERIQFNKPIYEIPAVTNMLIDMRVTLESNRALLYEAARAVDVKEQLEYAIEAGKRAGRSTSDLTARLKEVTRVAGLLTPLSKYILSEASNQIAYDSLQIHGGTGYMREFAIERLARDARITNIYEGTSQLQIVASIGGVVTDAFAEFFETHEAKEYRGALAGLAAQLRQVRTLGRECVANVTEKKDSSLHDVCAKHLVELYAIPYLGFLLLDAAEQDDHKVFIANRFVLRGVAEAQRHAELIRSAAYSDLLHADRILV
jgi:alkylation response protein AidB-like acyl-CoA dehydrogenase